MDDILIFRPQDYLAGAPVVADKLEQSEVFFRQPILTPETIGTAAIGMALFILPPGQRTRPHRHAEGSHTAIYVIKGTGTSHIGDNGERVHRTHPGDVIYIPPGVTHYKINDGEEAIVAVVVRTQVERMAQDLELPL